MDVRKMKPPKVPEWHRADWIGAGIIILGIIILGMLALYAFIVSDRVYEPPVQEVLRSDKYK